MKKFKLFALTALFAMCGMNAFAAAVLDEDGRSVNGVNYELWTDGTNKYALVQSVNNASTEAQQNTISIPAEVTGEAGTYKVQGFNASWYAAIGAKDVTAVTTSLSIDVTNFTAALANIDGLTKLESLTITDNGSDSKNKALNLSSASFKTTLKTLDISGSKIEEIKDNGLKDFAALTAIDLGQIKTIGKNALDGCKKVKSLTIPATVESVGDYAFDNMADLETLVWNAKINVPAAFASDNKLKSITVASAEATTIASGAFTSTVVETIDLSGSPQLATITGAFAASTKLEKCLLAGTDISDITSDPALTACAATLKEITFPAKITALPKFKNFKVLEKIDLSGTKVTAIDAKEFQYCEALTEVSLNAETASIGANAFDGCTVLATISNLNNEKLATVGAQAFKGTALTTVDLSATALTSIPEELFADCAALETVVLPEDITDIAQAAFTHCVKLSSLNLEDTQITTLEMLFTSTYTDESAPCDALKSLTLPETLTTVKRNALQMTGLEEITIPSSVTTWGKQVLQGCTSLKKFTWEDPDPSISLIGDNTFLGDDKLEEVYFITKQAWTGISDSDFAGNDPARLNVYVNAESYASLYAGGWTPANTKYATLVGEAESEYAFNAKGKSSDGYYYATYYNANCDTWFPEADFEVFSAIVNGSKIELVPATAEAGYYKVAKWDGASMLTATPKNAVAVVRSKSEKANVEYKYLGVYESTMPTDNALQINDGTTTPSRLKFQYKLGVKDGQVKFWRITSGTLKDGAVFIDSANPKAPEFLDIVIGNEATAIDAVETVEAENAGAIYNLQGIRVNKVQKGIYIQNGKKFSVK